MIRLARGRSNTGYLPQPLSTAKGLLFLSMPWLASPRLALHELRFSSLRATKEFRRDPICAARVEAPGCSLRSRVPSRARSDSRRLFRPVPGPSVRAPLLLLPRESSGSLEYPVHAQHVRSAPSRRPVSLQQLPLVPG